MYFAFGFPRLFGLNEFENESLGFVEIVQIAVNSNKQLLVVLAKHCIFIWSAERVTHVELKTSFYSNQAQKTA